MGDKATAKDRESIVAAFNEVGEKIFEQKEEDRAMGRFFTVKGASDLAGRIRQMCKLEEVVEQPQLVLLDIPDSGGYYVSSETGLNKSNIEAFIKSYKNKTIS